MRATGVMALSCISLSMASVAFAQDSGAAAASTEDSKQQVPTNASSVGGSSAAPSSIAAPSLAPVRSWSSYQTVRSHPSETRARWPEFPERIPGPLELGADIGALVQFPGVAIPFHLGSQTSYEVTPRTRDVMFAIAGRVGLELSDVESSTPIGFGTIHHSMSNVALELQVSARAHRSFDHRVGVYAELGLGMLSSTFNSTYRVEGPYSAPMDSSSNLLQGILAVAGGAEYTVAPGLKIFIEPFGFRFLLWTPPGASASSSAGFFSFPIRGSYLLLAGVRYAP